MNFQQALQDALERHRQGELQEAERLYRSILAENPEASDVLCLLGGLVNQLGRHQEAIELIKQALAVRQVPEYYFDLAQPLMAMHEYEQATAGLRQAIALDPDWPDAHAFLGTILQSMGQVEQAIECQQAAIGLDPNNAAWHFNLGNALAEMQARERAVDAFKECLRLNPKHMAALNNLGHALYKSDRLEEAELPLRQALDIEPSFAPALHNLGCVLYGLDRYQESVTVLRQAIGIDPKRANAYEDLGISLRRVGQLAESIEAYRRGLELNPQWPEALSNLSLVLCDSGRIDDAIAAAKQALMYRPDFYMGRHALANALSAKNDDEAIDIFCKLVADRPIDGKVLIGYAHDLRAVGRHEDATAALLRAMELSPNDFRPGSNYLFRLQFQNDDPVRILQEHRKWDARFAAPLAKDIRRFTHDRSPNRRLRIGYLSPDFCTHCQALFTSALFPRHDNEQFEVYCYSLVKRPDAVTTRLQQWAQVWRHIAPLSDKEVSELIRADGIDVLVDLTMHMRGSRPLIFARKPAPIQLAWLAYPGTTGLSTMDYRLTDPYLDPPGFDDRYTERSVRLGETFWCYEPRGMCQSEAELLPEPNELPAAKNGFVTFGCLNDFAKLNDATLLRWGRLMRAIGKSRLHLLARPGRCRESILNLLQSEGISADRIAFVERQPRPAYLSEYQRIDLCLDTLPYNGHTTSLDAFWMGVPVLTQIGRTVVGRAGLSQLMNLQLPDFAAENEEQFFTLGQRWAKDLPALTEIRRTLRERVPSSPLMDGQKFARRLESAFRQMWRQWIAES
jgi:predicted O-linked N-acetylglucosamine transferase (SPINDLY family)